MPNELTDALGSMFGANFGFSASINAVLTFLAWFLAIGALIYFVWWMRKRKEFNIIIRGHEKRGNADFEFDDMAKLIIKFNQSKLKLKKRKQANVIIPPALTFNSFVNGLKVLHIYRYGTENDYSILNSSIEIPSDEYPLLDADGNQQYMDVVDELGNKQLDADGKILQKPILIKTPKFRLEPIESLSKEHSILDIREAVARMTQQSMLEKYGTIIMAIIIGLTLIITAWVYGKYMNSSAKLFLQGVQIIAKTFEPLVGQTIAQASTVV